VITADWAPLSLIHWLPQPFAAKPPFTLAIVTMNHQFRILRQLGATCLGLAFSLLVLIATPALSAPAQESGSFNWITSPLPLAATAGRVKAGSKEFEGKTQESIGNVTGNKGDRFAGKAKQAEAKVRNAVEDVKDKAGMG
jgi:uncharacterized protein YjbJ (UPF0337 family)